MSAKFKRFPPLSAPCDSWFEDVPKGWVTKRLRHVLRRRTERNRPNLPLLSVIRDKGVILRDATSLDENHNYIPDDLSNYKVVRIGQFAMNKMKAWQGSYGVSSHDGIVSPAYFVFDVFGVDVSFFHVAIRSLAYVPAFTRASDGVRIGQWDLAEARMREIPFLVPPSVEQRRIVRFLDHADRRIQRYIRAKQKLIALLEEHKQAIIHQTVTGQIDVRTGRPYPAYRTSRTECLGGIPKHWKLARLKDVAQVQPGLTLGKDYGSIETVSRPYLRVANVQDGRIDLSHVKSVEVPVHEARATTLLDGDVLMTEGGDIDKLGRGGMWRDEIRGCLHQNHIFAVRCCQESLKPEFLVGLMASRYGRLYFQLTAKQTTNLASTNSNTLRAFPVPLPSVDEQKVILRFLSRDTRVVDEAIGRTERLIHGVREYRARLINDVVTGRVDVRDALASRPDRMPVEEFRVEQEGVTV